MNRNRPFFRLLLCGALLFLRQGLLAAQDPGTPEKSSEKKSEAISPSAPTLILPYMKDAPFSRLGREICYRLETANETRGYLFLGAIEFQSTSGKLPSIMLVDDCFFLASPETQNKTVRITWRTFLDEQHRPFFQVFRNLSMPPETPGDALRDYSPGTALLAQTTFVHTLKHGDTAWISSVNQKGWELREERWPEGGVLGQYYFRLVAEQSARGLPRADFFNFDEQRLIFLPWTIEEKKQSADAPERIFSHLQETLKVSKDHLITEIQMSGSTLKFDCLSDQRGEPLLRTDSITDWNLFATVLAKSGKEAARSPGKKIWEYLGKHLQERCQNLSPTKTLEPETIQKICQAINALIREKDFYDPADWNEIALSDELKKRLQQKPENLSEEATRLDLHRHLLEIAFHEILQPSLRIRDNMHQFPDRLLQQEAIPHTPLATQEFIRAQLGAMAYAVGTYIKERKNYPGAPTDLTSPDAQGKILLPPTFLKNPWGGTIQMRWKPGGLLQLISPGKKGFQSERREEPEDPDDLDIEWSGDPTKLMEDLK